MEKEPEIYFENGDLVVKCECEGVVLNVCIDSDEAYNDERIIYKW